MLVAVQRGAGAEGEGLSGAEDQVVRLLRSWTGRYHLPGVALVNVNVPDKRGPRQVDALVFTPHGLVVVEVKGFTRAQPGTLTVPLNGPWTVNAEPAALHTLAGLNPGEQVKAGVYAAKNAFTAIDGGGDTFVTGLVVLVHPGTGLTVGDTHNAGRGIHVVLATQTELRKAIHRHRHGRPKVWSADGVLDACRALALSHLAPSRAELLTEGFPDLILTPAAPPPATNRTASPPRPDTTQTRITTPYQQLREPAAPRVPPPRTPPRVPPPSIRHAPPRRPPARRRMPWGTVITFAIIITLGVSAIIAVTQLFQGR